LSKFADAIGDDDGVSLEMQLAAAIERVWRRIWRAGSNALRDAIAGQDQASVAIYMETKIK
jgi:hypothetical protein